MNFETLKNLTEAEMNTPEANALVDLLQALSTSELTTQINIEKLAREVLYSARIAGTTPREVLVALLDYMREDFVSRDEVYREI